VNLHSFNKLIVHLEFECSGVRLVDRDLLASQDVVSVRVNQLVVEAVRIPILRA